MTSYLLGVLGIVVSVALYYKGRRWTIGAARERASAANAHLERVLVRRLVLERHLLAENEIAMLVEGVARDYRVAVAEVHSTTQLLNTLYTRVMENDLILPEQREEALGLITPALAQSEATPIREEELEELESSTRRLKSTRRLIGVMAVLISVLAAWVAVLPEITTLDSIVDLWTLLPMITGIAGGSLALIGTLHSLSRLRESQEAPDNKREELSKYFAFEHRVRKALLSLGEVSTPSNHSDPFDFLLERAGKKFVIETKMWSRPNPASVALVARRLKRAANRVGGAEAVIVVRAGGRDVQTTASTEGVSVVTLEELPDYMKRTD